MKIHTQVTSDSGVVDEYIYSTTVVGFIYVLADKREARGHSSWRKRESPVSLPDSLRRYSSLHSCTPRPPASLSSSVQATSHCSMKNVVHTFVSSLLFWSTHSKNTLTLFVTNTTLSTINACASVVDYISINWYFNIMIFFSNALEMQLTHR